MFVNPYLATITNFAGNFAPQNWALCNGALMSISEYTALFSLIGTTYGGNGTTTFALPDFRGRCSIHSGQGPGLPSFFLGEMSGSESTTLLSTNLPAHNHVVTQITGSPGGWSDSGSVGSPSGAVPADVSQRYWSGANDSTMAPTVTNTVTGPAGGTTPVSNMTPYLAMNYIICVEGIYPSRN